MEQLRGALRLGRDNLSLGGCDCHESAPSAAPAVSFGLSEGGLIVVG